MDETIRIRPYDPQDRPAVRRICCDTADRGEPVERFFAYRELFADLITRYYTDEEPQSLWVAECAGSVIGYLSGCLESRRCQRAMALRIVPATLWKALRRGVLSSPQSWRFAWAGVCTLASGGGPHAPRLSEYPAHLHVNIQQGFRGREVGRGLVARFFEQVTAAGIRGVHAAVRADNAGSCRFFERMGFVEIGRGPVVFPDGTSCRVHETILYGRRL